MGTSSYIYAIGKRTLAAIVCALTLLGCDSVIYDGEGDCSVNYRVKFRYDMNLKFADAFAHEVESVTLYLLDGGGRVVWQRTESGEALGKEGYAMEVDVAPGTYDLLAWCGSTDPPHPPACRPRQSKPAPTGSHPRAISPDATHGRTASRRSHCPISSGSWSRRPRGRPPACCARCRDAGC